MALKPWPPAPGTPDWPTALLRCPACKNEIKARRSPAGAWYWIEHFRNYRDDGEPFKGAQYCRLSNLCLDAEHERKAESLHGRAKK